MNKTIKTIASLVLLGSVFASHYAFAACEGWSNLQTNVTVYKCFSEDCDLSGNEGFDRYTEYKTGCTAWCCPGPRNGFDPSTCDQEAGVWIMYRDSNGEPICCPEDQNEYVAEITCDPL